jgi:hypothetical protein
MKKTRQIENKKKSKKNKKYVGTNLKRKKQLENFEVTL